MRIARMKPTNQTIDLNLVRGPILGGIPSLIQTCSRQPTTR
jgi:hypothetical protein